MLVDLGFTKEDNDTMSETGKRGTVNSSDGRCICSPSDNLSEKDLRMRSIRRPFVAMAMPFLLWSATAWAGDLLDTRITFTIADNDLLRGPEETKTGLSSDGSPSIPNSLPSGDNRLFFDDFDKRDRGFENLSHLVLYTHQPGFFEGLDTEAALVMRLQVLSDKGVALSEDGSYLKASVDMGDSKTIGITAFPMSADRFRLGYSYDISWGDNRIFGNLKSRKIKANPGARFDFSGDQFSTFIGWKTAITQQDKSDGTTEHDTAWGLLAGGHLDVVDELRLQAGGGFFHRGTISKEQLKVPVEGGILTAPWQGYGASVQVTYHVGIPIGTPLDFRLYKNDPLKQQSFFKTEHYDEGVSLSLQSEISVLGQTLLDPDVPTSTVDQTAIALDFAGKLKIDKLRLHALAVYRNLAFILYNVPSLDSFVDFPDGIDPFPEVFVSLGIDYFIEDIHFTPGFIFGVRRPSYVTTAVPAGTNAPASLGEQTIVIRDDSGNWDILSPGDDVGLIYAAKFTGRFDLSNAMSALGEFQFSYDPNRRTFAQDPTGINVSVAVDPVIVGFNFMLQARF
jgi:hypothetical protein